MGKEGRRFLPNLKKLGSPRLNLDEEIAIKNAIGKTLYDMGYTKFAVAGGDMISGEIKNTVQKTTINKKEN